jgi:hypothetical protein
LKWWTAKGAQKLEIDISLAIADKTYCVYLALRNH